MPHDVINTPGAPAAIGPYSQAVKLDGLIFTAGQVALDPSSGQLVGDSVAAQTRQVLTNLSAVLQGAGASLKDVVKTTVFLVNMSDFAAMNEVYGQFFTGLPPARSTVAVAELPRKALVEIECIAHVDK